MNFKKKIKERYCTRGSCFDVWPPWSEDRDCATRACAKDCYKSIQSGPRSYCNLVKYLKTDPSKRCLPTEKSCNVEDTLIAPFWGHDYYGTIGVRLNQVINGQSSCRENGTEEYDSNYVGAGTVTPNLIKDGWLPISLIDTLAVVHDYHYYFTCGESESIWADRALYDNIKHVEEKYNAVKLNTETAIGLLGAQSILSSFSVNVTPGPSGMGEGWSLSQEDKNRTAEVLNAIDESDLIDNWAFFDHYRCGSINPKTGRRRIVLDRPRCNGYPKCPANRALSSTTYCD